MFATDFSFMFSFTRDLVTKIEIRKGQQGRSFLFFFSYLLGWIIFTGSNL